MKGFWWMLGAYGVRRGFGGLIVEGLLGQVQCGLGLVIGVWGCLGWLGIGDTCWFFLCYTNNDDNDYYPYFTLLGVLDLDFDFSSFPNPYNILLSPSSFSSLSPSSFSSSPPQHKQYLDLLI